MRKIAVALTLTLLLSAGYSVGSDTLSADIDRIRSSSTILEQIMTAPDSGIPDKIMDGAKCIAIVPSDMKVGFIFGANYGKGVATCRTTKGWSAPVFFRMTGGSFGFQIGGQASDLVLIVRTEEGMQHLLQTKFKLGGDASAAAGPVGRDAQAMTDISMRAQILTYSRARGLFAGVSLSGGVVRQDGGDTAAFYKKSITFWNILNGQTPVPPDAEILVNTVEKYAPTQRASARPAPLPMPAATTAPNPAPTATPAGPAPENTPPATEPAAEPSPAPSAAASSSAPGGKGGGD